MDLLFDAIKAPVAADCVLLRTTAGHSLEQMADLVHLAGRQSWWRFEAGTRQCNRAMWELALLRTDQHPFDRIEARK